ncbi:hypothetical protein RHGRI_013069 [Rhododendron griersonianum]|uniref:Uncharacterized protein n=1 Tax=Rhododendron griersonianum TaxID=479676 RepID=A0AAV6K484_9ERIC|nr:hypothetical protein RHGRI_013069 [Rhododendron griersonianum]
MFPSLEEANDAWRVYVETQSNVQLPSQPAQLLTDYPPLVVPMQSNVDGHGSANSCVYIAMFLLGEVTGTVLMQVLMFIFLKTV